MTFYLCPRRPWQRGSLLGDRSRPPILRLHPGGHRQLQQRWMTNKGQVFPVSERPKHRGDAVVHILINYKPWDRGTRWKLGQNQSIPSLSHPPGGCLGGFAWLGVTDSLTCPAISLVLLKTGISAGYGEWLSHRLRLTRSSNAIQQCDNQISANKSWLAAQLKSGSSCFWKGLFDNVIELYQREIMHGNVNNHKVIIFPSLALSGCWKLQEERKKSGDSMLPSPSSTMRLCLVEKRTRALWAAPGDGSITTTGLISCVKWWHSLWPSVEHRRPDNNSEGGVMSGL